MSLALLLAWLFALCGAPSAERKGRALFELHGRERVREVTFNWHQDFPPGPATHVERFQWPQFLWDKLPHWRKALLLRNLQRVHLSSAFSGYGGLEILIAMIVAFLNAKVLSCPISCPHSVEAGGKSESRRTILRSFRPEHRPVHVTGDICDRLPPDLMKEIKELLPSDSSHVDAKRFAQQVL